MFDLFFLSKMSHYLYKKTFVSFKVLNEIYSRTLLLNCRYFLALINRKFTITHPRNYQLCCRYYISSELDIQMLNKGCTISHESGRRPHLDAEFP